MHLGEKSASFFPLSSNLLSKSSLISHLSDSPFYHWLIGSDSCRIFTQRDILTMFYKLLGKDSASNWDEKYHRDWTSDKPECEWSGVTCEDGEVTGLSFPNSGLKL